MGYDSNNRFLYATPDEGISPQEVAMCIQDYRVDERGMPDVGMMCTSPKINPNARYKPENIDYIGEITESQRAVNRYGFGDKTPYFLAGYAEPQHAVYEYIPPKGGVNSPYRISDFNKYYHLAASPLSIEFPTKLYIDWPNGIAIRANDTGKTHYRPDWCIKLEDVMRATDDLFVALYIHKDANNQWLLPTNVKVKDLDTETFPIILFATSEDELDSTITEGLFQYILPDLGASEGEEYTLIAVGVQGLTYQEDKIPLSWHGGGNKEIGDRYLYSFELTRNADRKVIPISYAKTLDGLTGTFSATMTAESAPQIPGINYPVYRLSSVESELALHTPDDWFFTSQDRIHIKARVQFQSGYTYDNENNIADWEPETYMVLDTPNEIFIINDLLALYGDYKFIDYSPSSVNTLSFYVTIYAYRDQTYTDGKIIYQGNIVASKS